MASADRVGNPRLQPLLFQRGLSARMRDDEIAALREALASGDIHRQKKAARVLGELGPRAESAIEPLLDGVLLLGPQIAPVYASAICTIDPDAKRVLRILRESERYRQAAAY